MSDFLTISGKPIIEEYEDRSDDDVSAEIKDILSNLGINREGSYSGDDTYTINLKNSNDYGAISSLLDSSKDIEQIDETSYLTAENGNLDYKYNDDYMIRAKDDLLTIDDVVKRGNVANFENCGR